MGNFVPAQPYSWPFDGDLRPQNTALIIIDMQTDFCGKGGYIDGLGYDLTNARATIAPIQRVLARFRAGKYHVIHTREGGRNVLCLELVQNGSGTQHSIVRTRP